MKTIKKILYLSILALGLSSVALDSRAQTISGHFFGENAWMPDTIGNANNCTDPPCILHGKLYQQWANIKSSGASLIRFGGISPDKNKPTDYQYIRMIDSIRANGMEPVIQVPFYINRYTAQQAASIVNYINITKGRHIKYWIIGNEPNLGYSYTTAAQIAAYIKPFASAMKAVDPTILIVGPETAWYDQTIINGLTTPGGPSDITGKDAAGRYYVDVISFHTYPFNGTQTRAQVITKLTAQGSLQDNLASLNTRIASCNTYHNRTGAAALKTAITEANVNWQNNAGDNLAGNGVNSFIGGQFVAEMMGIGMKNSLDFINIWSVIEGNNNVANIGYIDPTTGNKKPLYYHFKMLAENFRGNYVNGSDNQANVKAFGSKDGQQVAVMIMNQELATNFTYTVQLDNSTINANSALKVNMDAGLNKNYTGTIANQSSLVLLFDAAGNITQTIEYKLNGNADANLPPTVTNILAAPAAPIATITAGGPTTFCSGSNVVLTAGAGAGYTFQWKKGGTAINAATNQAYTTTTSGSYTVVVTNAGGTATSTPVVVTVNPVPVANITAGGPTTFCEGNSVVLTADAGAGYVYQWKKDNVAIAGAITGSITATDAGSYTVDVNAGLCNAVSAAITITKTEPVAHITAGGPTTFCEGNSVVLTADAGAGYVYQWKKDNVVIAGAITSSITVMDAGSYTVDVNTGLCSAVSAAVAVIKTALPVASIAITDSTDACHIKLSTNVGAGYIYRWKNDSVYIAGAIGPDYIASSEGTYFSEITTACGSVTSHGIHINNCGAPAAVESALENTIQDFRVYPNPAVGKFTVELNNPEMNTIELLLISSSGQEVFHRDLLFQNGKEEIELPGNIATGVYVLRIRDGNKSENRQVILN